MNKLRMLRKEKGWTQSKLAEKVGVVPSVISEYEAETVTMSAQMLQKLSEIFNVSIDYLLCKTEIRNIEEIKFANSGGLETQRFGVDVHGLSVEDLMELQRQADYMRKIKGIK